MVSRTAEVWFFYLQGGSVDGLAWRVTLLPDGQVAFYDTIHNCGCYHMVFPTGNVSMLKRQSGREEPMLFVSGQFPASCIPVIRV